MFSVPIYRLQQLLDISETVLGQYYRIRGPELGRYVLADEFEQLGARTDSEEVLITARSL